MAKSKDNPKPAAKAPAVKAGAERCFEPGFWAAIVLPPDTGRLRVYVGEVQAVDDRGVRLTLIDWFVMMATGNDLFVPWANIQSAFIATPAHDLGMFIESARNLQEQMSPPNPAVSPAGRT